jgi:hypothetical protein
LPRRLMSWSGFATSFIVETQEGRRLSGVMAPDSGSHRICATRGAGNLRVEEEEMSKFGFGDGAR